MEKLTIILYFLDILLGVFSGIFLAKYVSKLMRENVESDDIPLYSVHGSDGYMKSDMRIDYFKLGFLLFVLCFICFISVMFFFINIEFLLKNIVIILVPLCISFMIVMHTEYKKYEKKVH